MLVERLNLLHLDLVISEGRNLHYILTDLILIVEIVVSLILKMWIINNTFVNFDCFFTFIKILYILILSLLLITSLLRFWVLWWLFFEVSFFFVCVGGRLFSQNNFLISKMSFLPPIDLFLHFLVNVIHFFAFKSLNVAFILLFRIEVFVCSFKCLIFVIFSVSLFP